ncbi:phosphotransferase family protein [Paenibacillus lignilyticus]|uniref:Aminoglycoside phosphotransferase family protein n=1 Tax=Paenibacillus lignilyticus TaxID=1172615 RepID=A0ABS5CCR4_9BACL|nr:aminoglycoside phosphotransferase family protein [Paenibacillus lignilyticus]MBP3963230.1 aminoglycoside phosphotransferase family protein [Paenibacillus lignilyticus]
MENSSVNQAEQIAGDYLQEQVISSYQILGKGFVNEVCVVETAAHKVVVRMNDSSVYPIYIKEKWCMEQAAAAGVPGPEVLAIGIAGDTAYMLQSFVDGDNGLDAITRESEVWRQLGIYVRRVHTIDARGFGEELINATTGEFKSPPHPGSDGSWKGYVQYNINSLTADDRFIELGVISQEESVKVKERFELVKRTAYRFGLNHGDLSLKNTLVSPTGEVRLLDWGSAEVHVVPDGDIMQVLQCVIVGDGPDAEDFQAFLDGYGRKLDDFTDLKPLMLLRAFDKLRWAIDRSPDHIAYFAEFARKVVEMNLNE